MDDREDVFYFVHGDGSNRVERKMKHAQINAERLASMFEVLTELIFGMIKMYGVLVSLLIFSYSIT